MFNKQLHIAIIGYGKLGKSIAEQAKLRNHIIYKTFDSSNIDAFTSEEVSDCDVLIECSSPRTAYDNLLICAASGKPTVCGTTGWLDKYDEVIAKFSNTAFLYASNFSIGMNITFAVNDYLAKLMSNLDYAATIDETHHTHKLDKPSGTAITLAKGIIQNSTSYTDWELDNPYTAKDVLPVFSHRIDEVPGTHDVKYKSTADIITLSHLAHDRSGFGLGAVLACEYIYDKQGVFTMRDVLGIEA